MGRVETYDVAAGVRLLRRALERSGLPHVDFARLELVRDVATLRAYLRGEPIPRVVRDRLKKLARRPRLAQ